MPGNGRGALSQPAEGFSFCDTGGGDHVTADAVDPFALLTATEAARYARVSVQAVCNWRKRGHLPVATNDDGTEITDERGRPMYRLVDVAKADAKMSAQRESMVRRLAGYAAVA
jgi:hypothetical protein